MSNTQTLADRQKEYEDVTRFKLPRKSYIICRCDGNAFHTYTSKLPRPFDYDLIHDMDETAKYLCKNIQNVKFAYVQSDEISLFMYENGQDTQPWFDNTLQKMTSIAAAKATSEFNRLRYSRALKNLIDNQGKDHAMLIKQGESEGMLNFFNSIKTAEFDARFWVIPSAIEVYNYFLWRQRDATKNSISAAAQSMFSHKLLEKKNSLHKIDMMKEAGVDWNDYSNGVKYGRFIEKVTYINGQPGKILKKFDDMERDQYELDDVIYPNFTCYPELLDTDVVRSRWEHVECPIFSEKQDFLLNRIKLQEQ